MRWLPVKKQSATGFTLLEIGMVLIIAGIIMFVSTGAWTVLLEGKRVSATRNLLNTSNSCLQQYTTLSKRVPTTTFFSKNCMKIDPWGNALHFFSGASAQEINCTTQLSNLKNIKRADGSIIPSVAWIIVSPGPNKKLDLVSSTNMWDLSKGDDIYVFVTDMELHQKVCN